MAVGEPGQYRQVVLSPDGKLAALTVAMDKESWRLNLWLLDLDRNILSPLTTGERDADPVWSPDSREILYGAYREAGPKIDLMRFTLGEQSPRLLLTDGRSNKSEAWSPDGSSIVYRRDEVVAMTMKADGTGKPAILLDTPFWKSRFTFSPDGRWLAYVGGDSPPFARRRDRGRIYISSSSGTSATRQVSTAFGCTPLWRKDGKELFYMAEHGEIMSVDTKPGSVLVARVPKMLFQPPVGDVNYCYGIYSASGDGQKFLVIESPSPNVDGQIHVMMHWDRPLTHEVGL